MEKHIQRLGSKLFATNNSLSRSIDLNKSHCKKILEMEMQLKEKQLEVC